MKKPYSLDYSIQRDVDRVAAVYDILDTLEKNPSRNELEQMASYILYGKDAQGKNAVQRGEMTDGDKRYATFKRKEDKNVSLDSILDNPLADQQTLQTTHSRSYTNPKPVIRKPKYDKKTGQLLDIGDADIPGMQQLWQTIERLERVLAANEGKIPPDEDTTILPDSYHLYLLRHQLADLRKHQYYLKDAYKPPLRFLAADHPKTQFIDWNSDAAYWISLEDWQERVDNALLSSISHNLEDYETRINPHTNQTEVKWIVRHHIFDWESPLHIRALINNYEALYEYVKQKLDTYSRALIFDFQRYRKMCHFSPVREFLLDEKIQHTPYPQILEKLQIKFGLSYNENHLSTILSKEIPNTFALAVKKHRLQIETPPSQKKRCFTCGRLLPRTTIFFGINNNRRDHFASNCKECEKRRRIAKGGQGKYDKRSKDKNLH